MAEEEKQKAGEERESKKWYDKHYKLLFLLPVILLVFSLFYISFFYAQNKDLMHKDVTLTGGTTITVYAENSPEEIEKFLSVEGVDASVRSLADLRTGKQIAFSVESAIEADRLRHVIEKNLGYNLTEENSSIEFTGSALSESFYNELMMALIIAFFLMAIVVFIIFRTTIPSLAVIFAAFSDIVITLAIIDFFGIRLSTAGIAAFLMLIGYSVDTDIMLTTRLLRRKESFLLERMKGALRTGLTMTITSIAAVFSAYLIIVSPVLKQLFLILTIGLCIDLITTWLGNASLLKWYCDKKHIL